MTIQLCSLASAVFLLTGCSQIPDSQLQASAAQPIPLQVAAPEREQPKGAEHGDSDEIQYEPISPELLYIVLAAEIAGQRGDLGLALEGYLEALKITDDPEVAERATQIALFAKNIDKASETVTKWIASDPSSDVAQKIATMVALQQGDGNEAAVHLRALLKASPDEAEDTLLEVVKVIDRGAGDPLAVMGQIVSNLSEYPEVHYGYALLASDRDRQHLALQEIETALDMRPDWPRAKVLYVQVLADMGELEKARDIMEDALDADESNVLMRLIYAQLLVREGEFEDAESQFEKILAEDTEQNDARYALALVKLQLGEDGEAKTLFLELLNVPKWQKQAYLSLGRLAQKEGDFETALAWYERVPPGTFFLEAQMGILSVLSEQGELEAALQRLDNLRERFPNQAIRFYLMEVELLNQEKNYEGAFQTLNAALNDIPDEPQLLYARAIAAERVDQLDVLEADLKKILEGSPNDAHALNALGYTLVDRTSRFDEAKKYLDQAIALRPNDPVIIDSYGWLKYKLGNAQEALDLLRRAYNMRPDPEIAIHIVEILWDLGQEDDAREMYAEAVERFSGSDYLEEIRQRLPQLKD